jgi:uncharacterized YccA/Bax inhibitor family protein
MMKTANPVLSQDVFRQSRSQGLGMTVQGTALKTGLLLILAVLSASWLWLKFVKTGNPAVVQGWMMGGMIVGFILAICTTFKKEWSAITAPLYAIAQGLFIGGISAIMETAYPGIVVQAATCTFGTLAAMLFVYQSGLIRPTETFKMIVVSATAGIALVYFIGLIVSFFGVNMSFLYGNGLFSILFSVFVIGVAALNFVIDFDFIEKGAKSGAPQYMEWYGAFAMMVTMVWLYIEFLRLLAKLKSRD